MSAYVVADETINDAIVFLRTFIDKNGPVLEPFYKLGYQIHRLVDREKLAKDLFRLNVAGVEARYGRGQAKQFRNLDFKYNDFISSETRANVIQCKKSLSCLSYQCSEGNVPERDLYKALEQVIKNIEVYIESLPDEDKQCLMDPFLAEWG